MWIIIDHFGDFPMAVVEDTGDEIVTKTFETKKAAEKYAGDELQNGYWTVIESKP